MPDAWDPPKLVKSFPVVLDGCEGAVEVWRDGEWSYYTLFTGSAYDAHRVYPPPLELQTANYQAGEWIREQVADCPHENTEAHSRLCDTGSGDWEVETCLDCEQDIRAGHI